MRILVLSYFYEHGFGGAELVAQFVKQLLETRLDCSIDVVCFSGGRRPRQESGILRLPVAPWIRNREQAFKRVVLFLNNRVFDNIITGAVARLPGLGTYDLVHCQDINALNVGYRLAQSRRIPLLLTAHSRMPRVLMPGEAPLPIRLVLNWLSSRRARSWRQALGYCHSILCVSHFIRRQAEGFLQKMQLSSRPEVVITYNPIEPYFLTPPPADRPKATERVPKLLFLGRLTAEKGLDLLLDAIPSIGKEITLGVLGMEGPLSGRLRAQAGANGNIKVLEPVPHTEVRRIIEEHDIVCCPSIVEEALGKTVLEARALRKRVVVTDLGGIPEVIEGYGRAFVVPVRDQSRRRLVSDLAAKIAEAVREEPAELTPAELERERRFVEKFSVERLLDRYRATLASLKANPTTH